jgi:NADPH:quinone reductase-like Zn-dependent oxidoreductase
MRMPFQRLVEQAEAGTLHVQVAKTLQLDQIVDAHRSMERTKLGR